MSVNVNLSLTLSLPSFVDKDQFLALWYGNKPLYEQKKETSFSADRKSKILAFYSCIESMSKKVVISVEGFIVVARAAVDFQQSPKNNENLFYIACLDSTGSTYCQKTNIVALSNFNNSLKKSVVRSFAPGTFSWDASLHAGEEKDEDGYVIY